MGNISNDRVHKNRPFRELSNYMMLLIRALEVNTLQTNTPPPHMVHENPIEWPTQVWK